MRMKDDVAATNCFARVVSLIFFPYFIHNCAFYVGEVKWETQAPLEETMDEFVPQLTLKVLVATIDALGHFEPG